MSTGRITTQISRRACVLSNGHITDTFEADGEPGNISSIRFIRDSRVHSPEMCKFISSADVCTEPSVHQKAKVVIVFGF